MVVGRYKRQGTYWSVPIPTDTVDDVEIIRRKYRADWAEFLARTAERTAANREANLQQARAEGLEEGRHRGREEGRAAGRAEAEAHIAELERQLAMQRLAMQTQPTMQNQLAMREA